MLPSAPIIATEVVTRGVTPAQVEFDWATETARHVGTVVHRELQRLARSGEVALPGAEKFVALQARFVAELAELGVPQDRRQTAAVRALEARAAHPGRSAWPLAARLAAS